MVTSFHELNWIGIFGSMCISCKLGNCLYSPVEQASWHETKSVKRWHHSQCDRTPWCHTRALMHNNLVTHTRISLHVFLLTAQLKWHRITLSKKAFFILFYFFFKTHPWIKNLCELPPSLTLTRYEPPSYGNLQYCNVQDINSLALLFQRATD